MIIGENMSNLFVPILESKEGGRESKLFSINSKPSDLTRINGFNPRDLIKKIDTYFFPEKIDFSLLDFQKEPFERFSNNTESISLGVFCSAFATINKRITKSKYGSITITGNFELSEKGVELFEISLVEEKFQSVQEYASEHKEEHHLFIYVSPNEVVKEGLHENNLLVIRFDSNSKIEEVFAEIFEPEFTDEQKKSIEEFYLKNTNEFVQTRNFINWKKEIVRDDCGGFIIEGESNTGKSIASKALCEHLIATNTVDNFVWISVTDNSNFLSLLRKDNEASKSSIFGETKLLLKEEYEKEFNLLDNDLNENKRICIILDNIEYDFIDEILDFLINNYKIFSENLKVIFTSWYKSKSKVKRDSLKLCEKDISEIALTRLEFDSIVSSVVDNSSYKHKFIKSDKKDNLVALIYSLIPNNPGFIPLILSVLNTDSVENMILRFQSEDVKNLNPKTRILKIALSVVNIFSQMVFFSSFNFKQKDGEWIFNSKKLCDIITQKIFKKSFEGKIFLSSQNIENALTELENNAFLYRTGKNSFIIKNDILSYCVFAKSENKEISVELENLRNALIGLYSKIRCSILIKNYDEFETFIKEVKNQEKLSEFLIESCENLCDIRFIKKAVEYGADVNFVDKNQTTCLEHVCLKYADANVVDFLLNQGADIFKKTNKEESYLITASTNNNYEILEYILRNKLYKDINEKSAAAFSRACLFSSNIRNLELLLENGINVPDSEKEGIRIAVCLNGNSDIFNFIFTTYPDEKINQKFSNELAHLNGFTYLHIVSFANSNLEIFKKLLSLGGDFSIKSNDNNTILHYATINKKTTDILEYVLENKLFDDFHAKNDDGLTALDLARERNYQKAIELLEKYERKV